MPFPPPRIHAATLGVALLLALLSAAPAAQAWTCRPDPMHLCQFVQETTGLVFDARLSPDGIGLMLLVGVEDHVHQVGVAVCVQNLAVWVSMTGYCSSPPHSSNPPLPGLLP